MNPSNLASWIANNVRDFCELGASNSLHNGSNEKAWAEPVVAFARGDDPLFENIKQDIGPFYWTPADAFALAFPHIHRTADELSVISWILPQTEKTKADHRREKTLPAKRWALSRFFGEQHNILLREHLVAVLGVAGVPAVAPERLPDYRSHCHSERFGFSSTWSERHVAWIAGHGTFGLSNGLITRSGKAVRFGSVVVAGLLPPTPRPYQGHQDWCLWYTRGTCGACLKRCPANAIGDSGNDKDRCFQYTRSVTGPYAARHFGTGANPCGLCQVSIPCESGVPAGLAAEAKRGN